jgi:ComF family protein
VLSILPQAVQLALKQLQRSLLPGTCLLCSSDSEEMLLCRACSCRPAIPATTTLSAMQRTDHARRTLRRLPQGPPAFAKTRAIFRYEFPVDRIIHAYKYGHQIAVAEWAAELIANQIQASEYDLLIPMPLHPARLRERGFNQSVEIARRIASKMKLPLDSHSLIRRRATSPQAELPMKERARNVRGAFECKTDLSARRILLIDDVMTTGATLREAARVIKLHGAAQIDVAVVARALKH